MTDETKPTYYRWVVSIYETDRPNEHSLDLDLFGNYEEIEQIRAATQEKYVGSTVSAKRYEEVSLETRNVFANALNEGAVAMNAIHLVVDIIEEGKANDEKAKTMQQMLNTARSEFDKLDTVRMLVYLAHKRRLESASRVISMIMHALGKIRTENAFGDVSKANVPKDKMN